MQNSDADQECLGLFDPNTYQEGQGPRLGNCYIPPTYEELMAASTENGLNLLPNNKEKFFEFILKEQQVRLNPKVQQLYKDMNHSSAVEHAIHSELFKNFGYSAFYFNFQSVILIIKMIEVLKIKQINKIDFCHMMIPLLIINSILPQQENIQMILSLNLKYFSGEIMQCMGAELNYKKLLHQYHY